MSVEPYGEDSVQVLCASRSGKTTEAIVQLDSVASRDQFLDQTHLHLAVKDSKTNARRQYIHLQIEKSKIISYLHEFICFKVFTH